MNPPQEMTEESAPADALLHWAALIAKAAALGFGDTDSEAQTDIPRIGFRTIPAPTDDRDLAGVERPQSPISPPATKGPIR